MRALLAAVLLLGCSFTPDTEAVSGDDPLDLHCPGGDVTGELEQQLVGVDSANPNPLTFWWYAGDEVLGPAIECALQRVRAAACLPVDISMDAHHWIRQRPVDQMGGRMGWTTGAWDGTRIKLLEGMEAEENLNCRILVHELGHILRRSNGHVGPGGEGSTKFLEPNLAAICAVQNCGCFNPEE